MKNERRGEGHCLSGGSVLRQKEGGGGSCQHGRHLSGCPRRDMGLFSNGPGEGGKKMYTLFVFRPLNQAQVDLRVLTVRLSAP